MQNKFYWIKLRTDFFNKAEIDFMLSQTNGCQYVVLYQMLCLNTANNYGRLESRINEVIIPYNIDKIVRDCKYFDYDTVAVALELYKRLGLIYETDDKVLRLSEYNELVGSESANKEAIKKRNYRLKLKNQQENVELGTKEGTNCPTEIRDKRLEIRDKSIDNNIITTTNNIYSYAEKNFGRPLAPAEYDKINCWLSLFNESIIKYAIDISVINGKRIFSYVDGILKNWEGCNYTNLQDIIDNEDKKRKSKDTPDWYKKVIKSEDATDEEKESIDKLLKEIGVK